MGHANHKNIETYIPCNNNKEKDKDIDRPVSTCIFLSPCAINFFKDSQEWKLPHLGRPQQSTTGKTFTSQYCKRLRTHRSRAQELSVNKEIQVRVRD